MFVWFKQKAAYEIRISDWISDVSSSDLLAIVIAEFLAPYELHTRNIQHIYAPPQALHLFHEGEFIGPFVYGFDHKLDMETLSRVYTPNPDKVQPLRFFCGGDPYSFWGQFSADLHLFCPAEAGTAFLPATDRLDRDMLSRVKIGR